MRNSLIVLLATAGIMLYCTNDKEDNLQPKPNTSVPGNNLGGVPDTSKLSRDVNPIFNKYSCTASGCHGGSSNAGGVNLSNYTSLARVAQNGQLYCAASHGSSCSPMPNASTKMNDTELAILKKWIDSGAINN